MSDEDLVAAARSSAAPEVYLEALYSRYYSKVSSWCYRVCGDFDRAADAAQEVFLRLHTRLDSYRLEARFSTWLYTLTRRTAINYSKAQSLRKAAPLPDDVEETLPTGKVALDDQIVSQDLADRLRRAVEAELDPVEKEVLYLHLVNGMTLQGVTDLLGLENKSGAKAHVVSAKRKLKKSRHRWFGTAEKK